jgi:DNA processing protein
LKILEVNKGASQVKVIPIGGLNEIGKNMTLLEHKNDIMIIDCGLSFPEDEMFGIDIVIPDFSYLIKNREKVKGMILTHGHEDHIGAIPYLLRELNIPIYGTRLTLGLVENKLKEHGIDSFAHKGAVENNGKTIAVLGCGIDICYPAQNKGLRERILKEDGLIMSEYEPGTPPLPFRFPLRNRIISGISIGTIVIEAGISSGSLITAEYAAEQGRNIYTLPGNINSMCSLGTNKLIKDGAIPLITLDDIIDELGIARSADIDLTGINLGKDEKEVYEHILHAGETTIDLICRSIGKLPSEVNAIITILEMKGLLHTAMGKVFVAN